MARSLQVVAALVALAALCFASSAHAQGGTFTQRLPILPGGSPYVVQLNQVKNLGAGTSTVGTSQLATTTTPQALVSIQQCGVLSHHIHPRGTEELHIRTGSVEVGIFLEDGTLHIAKASAGSVVIIPGGSVHYVKNTFKGTTTFVQAFDNPNAGAIFIAQALLAQGTDRKLLNSNFIGANFDDASPSKPIFLLNGCKY